MFESKNENKSRLYVCGIILSCLLTSPFVAMAQASGKVASDQNQRSTLPILGTWIRYGDAYENMVMAIKQDANGKITGTLLYVPEQAANYHFRYFDQKMKNVQVTSVSGDEYQWQSLCRDQDDGSPSWAEVIVRMVSSDKFISRDIVQANRLVGGVQRWRRAKSGSSDMAYVHYGQAKYALLYEELDKAKQHLDVSVQYKPEDAYFCNSLAWLLATSKHEPLRCAAKAIDLATYACLETSNKVPSYIDTLAAAYATAGNYEKAVSVQQQAVDLIPVYTKQQIADELSGMSEVEIFGLSMCIGMMSEEQLQEYIVGDVQGYHHRLDLYKSHKPYID